jgi:type III secretion protein V
MSTAKRTDGLSGYFAATDQPREGLIARFSDLFLVAGIVAIVALMVLPLPLWLIDMLVAVNIASGLVLILIAVYVAGPLEFSVFPSVLLMTTLFRLALSIATTRLILLHADGGHIIATFGKMVAGGNLVVGLVVFLIITVVQFIVIAKGAERVAEVAARFSLDAMPGKQLSIDSDLRSGLIDKDEAKRRRRTLELESKQPRRRDEVRQGRRHRRHHHHPHQPAGRPGRRRAAAGHEPVGRRAPLLHPLHRRGHGGADPGAAGRHGGRPAGHAHQRRRA